MAINGHKVNKVLQYLKFINKRWTLARSLR